MHEQLQSLGALTNQQRIANMSLIPNANAVAAVSGGGGGVGVGSSMANLLAENRAFRAALFMTVEPALSNEEKQGPRVSSVVHAA